MGNKRGAPSGTVTFVFTDIEGSTRRWVAHEAAMAEAVARHDRIVTDAVAAADGYVFATGGDGFALAFGDAAAAVDAALAIQRGVQAVDFAAVGGLAVRIGIHTGPAEIRGGDYFGPEVARAARIGDIGHGDQVLLSATTASLVPQATRNLGAHQLRDFPEPQPIHQLVLDDVGNVDFPPLRTIADLRTTLPSPRSAFFGRDDEIDRVRRLLVEHHIVTLTGVGGTGKTRLAVETGWEELPGRRGGVYFVDLTSATGEDELLAAAVSGTMSSDKQGADPRQQLFNGLAGLDAVVVLDNCEHLLDDSADLVEDLLDACPELRIVVTSREPLDVGGEQVVRVASLAASSEGDNGARRAQGPAVRLFVDRAHAAAPDLDLVPSEPVVREICERLDGIPLAIELAAARVRVLTPDQLLERLDDRFRVLTGSRRRRGHQRQKTLEATVAWSFDLLDDEEKRAFRRLAVLERGFDLAATSSVIASERTSSLDLVDSLVAKSLVVRDPDSGRFHLLETLRQYAEERLVEAGDADETRDAHLRHYIDALPPPDFGRPTPESLSRRVEAMFADRTNIAAALAWAEDTGQDDALVDLLSRCNGNLAVGIPANVRWFDVGIERAHAIGAPAEVQALLHLERASFSVASLDVPTWRQSVLAVQELIDHDHPLVVRAISLHGFLRITTAPALAVERCEQAAAMADRLGLDWLERGPLAAHLVGGLMGLRRYEEALEVIGEERVHYEGMPDDLYVLWPDRSMYEVPLLHLCGRTEDALEVMRDGERARAQYAGPLGWSPSYRLPSAATDAMVLFDAGDIDEAIRRVLDEATFTGHRAMALTTDLSVLGFGGLRARLGDVDRAHVLLDLCVGYRTPATLAMLVELTAEIERWPDVEFHTRRQRLVDRRFDPTWIERSQAETPQEIQEEIEHFTSVLAERTSAA